ncbi:hypothetical protein [Paenibacillus terreus]
MGKWKSILVQQLMVARKFIQPGGRLPIIVEYLENGEVTFAE